MKKTILIISLIFLSLCVSSKSVEWTLPAIYEEIKPYERGIYLIKKDGKWGLAKQNGEIMLPTQYDFITRPIDGVGMFGTSDNLGAGNKANRIYGTIKNNKIYSVNKPLYLTEYRYFCEGKLVVQNGNGLRGFITDECKQIIACQFQLARPFSEGFAFVTVPSSSLKASLPAGMYITDSYDVYPEYSVLPIDWNDGDISNGSSFKDGRAVVQYDYLSAVIDNKGRKKGNNKGWFQLNPVDGTLKGPEEVKTPAPEELQLDVNTSISIVKQNGLYGYDYYGDLLVAPTLQDAQPFYTTGFAIANNYGKYGLLCLIDGSYRASLMSNNDDEKVYMMEDPENEQVRYNLRIPERIDINKIHLMVDDGSGNFSDMSGNIDLNNGMAEVSFVPVVDNNKDNLDLGMKVEYEDLCVFEQNDTLELEYPVVLRIDDSYTTSTKADAENDTQSIATRITNDGNKEITITVIIKVECYGNNKGSTVKKKVVIPAKGSTTVTSVATVYDPEKALVTVSLLDRNEKHSSSVQLRPAY